jgi:hypothetical protein
LGLLGAHLGLHLASVVAWRFHQHQVPSFSKQSRVKWVENNLWPDVGSKFQCRQLWIQGFLSWRPLGTRKKSVHCLWFLCCCTQTLHRTPFGTSSYFTHVDVCFGLLFTAL